MMRKCEKCDNHRDRMLLLDGMFACDAPMIGQLQEGPVSW